MNSYFTQRRRRRATAEEVKRDRIAAHLRDCERRRESESEQREVTSTLSNPWMWLSSDSRGALQGVGFTGLEDVQEAVNDVYFWRRRMITYTDWTGGIRLGDLRIEVAIWTEFMLLRGDLVRPDYPKKAATLKEFREAAVTQLAEAAETIAEGMVGAPNWLPTEGKPPGAIRSRMLARWVSRAMGVEGDKCESQDEGVLFLCLVAAAWESAKSWRDVMYK